MHRKASFFVSGGAVLVAALVGASNGPQQASTAVWYSLLRKPAFTPPGPIIGTAWTVLELLLVGTGYRLLQAPRSGGRVVALGGWMLTLLGLAGYPFLFFRRKRLAASTGAGAAMFVSAVTMTSAARKADPPAALLSVPLLLWLGFAEVLNEELWRRNPRLSRD